MNYVGLDVHKRTISFCVRSPDGTILQEGCMTALGEELDKLLAEVPAPCVVGLESTLFTEWVYDHLTAKGISVKVAHSAMLKAILRENGRTTRSMLENSPIFYDATTSPNATLPVGRSATAVGFCDIETCWSAVGLRIRQSALPCRYPRGGGLQ